MSTKKVASLQPNQGMNIEKVATLQLIPYARNAKRHDDAQVAQIAASIREFGFNNPVLIDADNGIIAGHGRVLAAQRLGLEQVPCLRLSHLTDSQRRAYIIADNRLAEIGGGWDTGMLALEIEDLRLDGFDLDLTGFDTSELDVMFGGYGGEDQEDGEGNEPESSTREIDPDDYKMGSRCPRCGFEFDDKKEA